MPKKFTGHAVHLNASGCSLSTFMATAHWLREEKFTSEAGVHEISTCCNRASRENTIDTQNFSF
jgi:hypothetical protein